jgi:hypothetical protein
MYVLVIFDAVSQGGDSLDMPYSMAFTTGSNLPTASVSGTISYPGNDPTGAIVMLFDNNPFVGGELINGAVVPSASGDYTVAYVEAGIYWPVVGQNLYIDGGGDILLRPSGSGVGLYDPNGDGNPDSIEGTGGATISNIDVTLFEAFPQTARDPFPNVESLVQAWAADANLVQVRSDWIGSDGNSHMWLYVFYSPLLMQHQGWATFGNGVVIAEPQDLNTVALPLSWLNSDSIMSVAEAHGGSNFRQQYPDAWVIAELGHSGSHQGLAVWVVEYRSDYDFLEILIDALTGDIVTQTIIPPGDVNGTWNVGGSPYLINGEITIPFLETLTIEPGVLVEFQGHYKLIVEGKLLAVGTEADTITFTINDTTGFSNPHTSGGGWHGIRFNWTSPANDSSKIIYCKLQYGKALGSSWPDQYGGAILVNGFDKLLISNCLITNNSASGVGYSGGGGVSAGGCNLQVDNCTFTENKALDTLGAGGAISYGADTTYTGFPYQVRITNCNFINNSATAFAGVFIQNWGDDTLVINAVIDNCEFINNASDNYTGLAI